MTLLALLFPAVLLSAAPSPAPASAAAPEAPPVFRTVSVDASAVLPPLPAIRPLRPELSDAADRSA
ncbi:MAG TPA: hypothetical protein VL404_06010 [Candidatus Eisenbacteria bacterium]|jgi:hypothetical protein|nr:hypothetical protein [Candidatus Eisenbacteria bacterium]